MVKQLKRVRVVARRPTNKTFKIIKKIVKREVKQNSGESKVYEPTALTSTNFLSSQTGSIVQEQPLGIPQGDNDGERIGNKIQLKGIQMKLNVNCSVEHTFRILAFWVKSEFAGTDLDTAFDNMDYLSFLPRNVSPQYNLLMDRTFDMDPDNNARKTITKYFKLNKQVTYDGVNGSDLQNGRLVIYFKTSNSTASSVGYDLRLRTYYRD